MKFKKYLIAVVLSAIGLIIGCTNPKADEVKTIKSPNPNVFYTVEIYNGDGPVSADVTKVYAHLEHDGKSDRLSVLEGEYLSVDRVTWLGPNEVSLCISHGATTIFRNRITLHAAGLSEKISTHLQEASKGVYPAPVSIAGDER